MTDTDEEKRWEERRRRMTESYDQLMTFVTKYEESGLLTSKEVSGFFKKMNDVLRKAGLIDGLKVSQVETVLHIAVFIQAMQEGRVFLKTCPGISDILDAEVPPFGGSRSI